MKVGDISQNVSKGGGNFYVKPLLSGSNFDYLQKKKNYSPYN